MELPSKRVGGARFLNNPTAFLSLLLCSACFFILAITLLRLPEALPGLSYPASENQDRPEFQSLGKFGQMMVQMLPDDLAFTVFVPSERAFERDLGLRVNHSLAAENWNDTYAVVSRVLGFSTVARGLFSHSFLYGEEERGYDSISGFRLYIWKDLRGVLVVNGVRSECVDLRKNEIVTHVMDGVIMDAEFEQSILPDSGE